MGINCENLKCHFKIPEKNFGETCEVFQARIRVSERLVKQEGLREEGYGGMDH